MIVVIKIKSIELLLGDTDCGRVCPTHFLTVRGVGALGFAVQVRLDLVQEFGRAVVALIHGIVEEVTVLLQVFAEDHYFLKVDDGVANGAIFVGADEIALKVALDQRVNCVDQFLYKHFMYVK